MDDRELARLAKGGDMDAYEMLLRRYQTDAQRAAYFMLGQREEAEDAVQEAFVKAWDGLHRFDPSRPFRPWLLKIVTNEARDRGRAVGRRERLRLRAARQTPAGGHSPSPEQQVVTAEQMQAAIDEINLMDATDQTIMTYRFVLDLPTAEIAELLDTPHGTIRSRISRARAQLRQRLAEPDEPDNDAQAREWTSHG